MNDLTPKWLTESQGNIPVLEPIAASVAPGLEACKRIANEYGYRIEIIGRDEMNQPIHRCHDCGCEFFYDPRGHKHGSDA